MADQFFIAYCSYFHNGHPE